MRYPTEVVVDGELSVEVDAAAYEYVVVLDSPAIDYSARQILFTDPQSFEEGLVVTVQQSTSPVDPDPSVDPTSPEDNSDSDDTSDTTTPTTTPVQTALIITIEGLRNPLNNEASASFEVVTFNRVDDVLYFIDQVVTGLEVDSNCDYPCKDCPSTDPTYCLSCFPASTGSSMPFLQENTCLETCSDGLYPDANDIC